MKRSVLIGFVAVGILLVWVIPRLLPPVFGQAALAQAPHIGEGGLPQFEKDPAWPKVPPKWKMGFGSAVAIDEQDHVWILSRARTLGSCMSEIAATSVSRCSRPKANSSRSSLSVSIASITCRRGALRSRQTRSFCTSEA